MGKDLSEALVDGLNGTYGVHAGHRAAHAKGVLCAATFTPTPEARALSRAAHFAGPEVRAHVRFSNGGGDPTVADGVRDGRGIGVKFYLPDGTRTDIVGVSLPAFFTRTPEDLVAFNAARRPDPVTGDVDMDKVGAYLAEHPEAMTAVMAAIGHPIPASYATITFNGLHAFGFESEDGAVRHGRYHIVPAAGEQSIADDEAGARSPDYLREELVERLANGPALLHLDVELADDGDPLDDPTAVWPEGRDVVRAGTLAVTAARLRPRDRRRHPRLRPDADHRRHHAHRRLDPPRPQGRVLGVGRAANRGSGGVVTHGHLHAGR